MEYVKYELLEDKYIRAIVRIGEASTPLWIQQRWDQGEYARYIRANGCGHCCTTMAARLHGVDLNPYEEFEYCRKNWGTPISEGKRRQLNWISVSGIVKVLTSFGIPAACFGVPVGGEYEAADHIVAALKEGKQVIIWSEPSEKFPENPFSKGSHYVLAVGFDENGKIVIANSSEKLTTEGVQLVDSETIAKSLFQGSEPWDMTWGEPENYSNSAGYVVVG